MYRRWRFTKKRRTYRRYGGTRRFYRTGFRKVFPRRHVLKVSPRISCASYASTQAISALRSVVTQGNYHPYFEALPGSDKPLAIRWQNTCNATDMAGTGATSPRTNWTTVTHNGWDSGGCRTSPYVGGGKYLLDTISFAFELHSSRVGTCRISLVQASGPLIARNTTELQDYVFTTDNPTSSPYWHVLKTQTITFQPKDLNGTDQVERRFQWVFPINKFIRTNTLYPATAANSWYDNNTNYPFWITIACDTPSASTMQLFVRGDCIFHQMPDSQ